MSNSLRQAIQHHLSTAQRVLVTSHKRPDGDAVGSVLGLGLALQDAGKEVQIVLVDGVQRTLQHLSGSQQVQRKGHPPYDLVVVLDCSELSRTDLPLVEGSVPLINIDHHATNLQFGTVNLVDTKATATCEILAELLPQLGLDITLPIAEALLTGLITDTIGFRTSNMTPKALRVAADLMEQGCDLPTLYKRALLNRTYEAVRYWGMGLNTLQKEDGLLWTTLSLEDREAVGYLGRDDADLINILSSIEGADVAVIFVEQADGTVKVSWRSRPGLDVAALALQLGGGGHKSAAGAELQGSLHEVTSHVLRLTRKLLEENNPDQ